ncbi:Sphingomyelin phosphodiesterase 2 [Armadillidium nasatum]|uniref:Sphingomyelin phosphodiesterase 2 n=1 Tax=Armadillidium nasatum TaxID=96803 RepID=A0A5N5SX75_9CRUS|nr:Sphingomyelin phosphodiesterase 2 [Armadillidium nasatum]
MNSLKSVSITNEFKYLIQVSNNYSEIKILVYKYRNIKYKIRGSTDDIDESSNEYAITENVMLITNEIHDWMSQPEQDYSNMPFHVKQLVLTLNKTNTKGSHDDTDRIFSGTRSLCGPCEMLASVVVGYSRIGGSINILANFLSKICFLFIYKDSKVCRGLIYQDKDRLNYIIKNTNVDGAALCSLALGSQGCGPFKGPSWALHIPLPSTLGGHPQISYKFTTSSLKRHTRRYRRQTIHGEERSIDFSGPESQIVTTPGKKSYKKTLKVLHLTDPHFDPEYKVGSNAVCEAPLCCNEDSDWDNLVIIILEITNFTKSQIFLFKHFERLGNVPRNPEETMRLIFGYSSSFTQTFVRRVKRVTDGAGIWGDYRNCDSPKWLIENMLQHIVNNHPDIDYILCTGDLVPHHIWRVNPDSNIHVIRDVTDMILHYFPKTPVYGAIGNHEAYPRDSFPPPEVPEVFSKFGNQWLYDAVSETWERLQKQPLPSTARYAGNGHEWLTLIQRNTNFCKTSY